jgi:hypothetical protein
VFLAPGLGQVWHVYDMDHPDTFVVSRVDVCGVTRWSLVEDIAAMAAHFGASLEGDFFAALTQFLEEEL